MPIIKSAQKRLRQEVVRRKRNLGVKSAFKKAVKLISQSVAAHKKVAPKSVSEAHKKIDKAAKKHVIHARKAARLKSRVSKLSKGSK